MLNDVSKRYGGMALTKDFFLSGYIILECEKAFEVLKHCLGQTKHITFKMQLNTVMGNFQKL